MFPKNNPLPLIRVLIALAWADGKISNSEMNFLKDFLFKFDFTGEDWAKIEMYIEEPVPPSEADALLKDFVENIGSRGQRDLALSTLRGLMEADGHTSPEEKDFLDRFVNILEESGPASSIMNAIKGLFQQTVFRSVQGSNRSEELYDFQNNKILFKVRRKLERKKLSIETHPDDLAYATLFGGLMACVASAHKKMDERELVVLRRHLHEIGNFDEEAVELILSVTQDAATQGIDRFRLTREFFQRTTRDQHLKLIDCLFDIAGSDMDLQHSEVEEVRSIAYGLKLSHRNFIDAKIRHLEKMKDSS